MKNVTITLPDDLASRARVEAAKDGKSLSRWIADRLAAELRETLSQREALEQFLSGPGYPGVAKDLPKRDELYDRPALRRHEHPDLQPRSRRPRKTG